MKFARKDWLVFIAVTVAAAVIWHLTDDGMNKLEGK